MKKILAFLLLSLCCLTACTSPQKAVPKQPSYPFECAIQITCPEIEAQAALICRSAASQTLEIRAPRELSGLLFNLEGETLTASYKGICFPLSEIGGQAVPAAKLLFEAISNAYSTEKAGNEARLRQQKYSGSVSGVAFEMTFSPPAGTPGSLSFPDRQLTISFKNFRFL